MINKIDINGDGEVSFLEFCTFLIQSRDAEFISFNLRKIKLETEDELQHAFNLIDEDGKGFINAAQLCKMYSSLGQTISLEQAKAMVSINRTEVPGQVNLKEFSEVMTSS